MPEEPAFVPTDDHLDQGDIFSDVPLARWKDQVFVQGSSGRAVITSHGCACEDYERALAAGRTQAAAKVMLHVAPLRAITNMPEHRLEEIKAGQQLDYFYIYGERNTLNDHLVDLSLEQPVPASVLSACTKIARLAPWQWRHLLVHIAVSRFHESPETLFRPELLESGGSHAA